MRTKLVVLLTLSALMLALLGSACAAARVVSVKNNTVLPVLPGFPTFNDNKYNLKLSTLTADWSKQYWTSIGVLLHADDCTRDKYGVCEIDRGGTFYNHPVVQANDGLYSLAIYDQNHNTAYLNRAEVEANRILSYKTDYDNAWWYPYKFTFEEYGQSKETITAPWYSGMAQGEILDLFTQLYRETNNASWKADASRTFNSFLDPWTTSKGTKPWVDIVDSSGYLWLEEYPTNPSDDVINGADFAIWGLVDYANEFNDRNAATLASGTLTTMLHAITLVRHPGWLVGYSVSHPTVEDLSYHIVVTEQFLIFAEITGTSAFANIALELASDFPVYPVTGAITLKAGPQLMAQARTFKATSVSTVEVPANTTANVVARVKLSNEPGFWYEVASSSGSPYAGLFIREQAGIAYYSGICNQLDFNPSLQTTFPAGSYILYTSNGQVLTRNSIVTLTSPEIIPVSNLETIGGITVWVVSSGIYDGYFMRGLEPTIE